MAKAALKSVPSGINLGDIVYVLFKHKWKILLLSVLTAAAATAYYLRAGVTYESQAKLIVKYLVERSAIDRIDSTTGATGREMDSIIKEEMAILTSWDLAESVAGMLVDPEAENPAVPSGSGIDPATAGKDNADAGKAPSSASESERISYRRLVGPGFDGVPGKAAAATAILKNLTATAERGSSVINITFRHSDPDLPQRVLDAFVQLYLSKHLAIHRSQDTKDMADRAKDAASSELNQASDALNLLLDKYRIVSAEDGSLRIGGNLSAAQAELNTAEAALEEQTARVKAFERLVESGVALPDAPPDAATAPSPPPATPVASLPQADAGVIENYRNLNSRLTQARTSHDTLLLRFKPDHADVRSIQGLVDDLMRQRREMERKHPELVVTAAAVPTAAGLPRFDLTTQKAELSALQARVLQLRKSLESAQTKAAEFAKDAPRIATAQRTLALQEESYKYLLTSWKKAQADTLLKAENIPNISTVQAPTPATKNGKTRTQIMLGILFGGPIAGVGLVLVFGLLLNRSIKRPLELEESMNLPLMLSIPYFTRRNRLKASRPMGAARTTKLMKESESAKAPWEQFHFIQPFAEALRDRLTGYFEATGNLRKPKLIAVTGYSVGAGTSTLAGGLAASLSEIGDGKVLLVDMSGHRGAAHPFFDGRPAVSLAKALRPGSANGTLPSPAAAPEAGGNELLFLARADAASMGAATVGLRRMMPQLKASDFDYIIFDMPPLGQTKPTATMAGFMDKVLVVVEAEANSRSDVRRGYKDLTDAGADVSMVFNKARSHGPKALVGSFA